MRTLVGESKGWINHPAVKMWAGFEECLADYWETIVNEWVSRGYVDNTLKELDRIAETYNFDPFNYSKPAWLGNTDFHLSHQSNLLRKDKEHYIQFFDVPNNLEYIWP
jgi:Pyrimidine dimer DNA glycosylase